MNIMPSSSLLKPASGAAAPSPAESATASNRKVMDAAFEIGEILSGLSNKEKRRAIDAYLGSHLALHTVPIGTGIAVQAQSERIPLKPAASVEVAKKVAKVTPPSIYGRDPVLAELKDQHSLVLKALKARTAEGDLQEVDIAREALKIVEARIASRKDTLVPNRPKKAISEQASSA